MNIEGWLTKKEGLLTNKRRFGKIYGDELNLYKSQDDAHENKGEKITIDLSKVSRVLETEDNKIILIISPTVKHELIPNSTVEGRKWMDYLYKKIYLKKDLSSLSPALSTLSLQASLTNINNNNNDNNSNSNNSSSNSIIVNKVVLEEEAKEKAGNKVEEVKVVATTITTTTTTTTTTSTTTTTTTTATTTTTTATTTTTTATTTISNPEHSENGKIYYQESFIVNKKDVIVTIYQNKKFYMDDAETGKTIESATITESPPSVVLKFDKTNEENDFTLIVNDKKIQTDASTSVKRYQFKRSLETIHLPSIRLIDLDVLSKHGKIPRFPDQKHLIVESANVDRIHNFVVFISHCWLRGHKEAEGWDGKPHPDNVQNEKFTLIVEGVRKLWKALAPEMTKCYLWIDFTCMDQDGNPAGELKQLDKIIEFAHTVFTPITGKDEWESKATVAGPWEDYKAKNWNVGPTSYLERGWCRVEMFYAANVPLMQGDKENTYYEQTLKAGLIFSIKNGRRPHFLYGEMEKKKLMHPQILPPLQNSHFEKFHPAKGNVTMAADVTKITELVNELKPYMQFVKSGYTGEKNDKDQFHGVGTYVFPNGNIYHGEFRNQKRNGKGKFTFADGNMYDGDWVDDKMEGFGHFEFSNGNIYDGGYKNGVRHGDGTFIYADKNVYVGEWKFDRMNGKGKLTYVAGNYYEGEYKDDKKHGFGKYVYVSGNIYEGTWEVDKIEGEGTLTYVDGDKYVGKYSKGVRNGVGKFYYKNGNTYDGEWLNDKLHGKGVLVDVVEKRVYEGEFKESYRMGKGIMKYDNGDVYEGSWKYDKYNGYGKLTHKDGIVEEGEWKDGVLEKK